MWRARKFDISENPFRQSDRAVLSQKLNPDVLMMESSEDWY